MTSSSAADSTEYSAFLDRISQDLLLSLPSFEYALSSLPPEPLVQAFLQSTRTLTKNNPTPPSAPRAETPATAGSPLEDSLVRTFPDFWNSLFELPDYQLVLYYLQAARIPPLLSPDSPLLPLFSKYLSDYYPYFLNAFNSLPPHHYLFFHSQLLRLTTPKPKRPPGRPKKNNPTPPLPPDTPSPDLSPDSSVIDVIPAKAGTSPGITPPPMNSTNTPSSPPATREEDPRPGAPSPDVAPEDLPLFFYHPSSHTPQYPLCGPEHLLPEGWICNLFHSPKPDEVQLCLVECPYINSLRVIVKDHSPGRCARALYPNLFPADN